MKHRKKKHSSGVSRTRTIVKRVYSKARSGFVGKGFSGTIKVFLAVLGLKIVSSLLFGVKDSSGKVNGGLIPHVSQDDTLTKYAILWAVARFASNKFHIPYEAVTVIEVKLSDAIIAKFGGAFPAFSFAGMFDGDQDVAYAGEGDIVEDGLGNRFQISNGQYIPLHGHDGERMMSGAYDGEDNNEFNGDYE
jgi:hypothetical protein